MVTILDNVLQLLTDFGFFRVVLPFLLIFAIFYAVILKTGVLGDAKESRTRSIAAIIAFVAAFLVISSTPVVEALNKLIPQASFLLVVTMLVLMLLTFIGVWPQWDEKKGLPWWSWIVVLIILLIFLGAVDMATGWEIPIVHQLALAFMGQTGVELGPTAANMLIGIGIIIGIPAVIIWMVMRAGAGEEEKK